LEHEATMERIEGSGAFCGFKNKAREENRRWWDTRKWLVQSVIWLLLINGISSIALIQLRQDAATFSMNEFIGVFTGLMGWMVAFGIIIMAQGDIVDEKQSGTAEWVLSSPLSRESFILSKLSVSLAWFLAILVVLQGAVFYLTIGVFNAGTIALPNLALGLALQGLYLAFWLGLLLMLGTFFKSRNPVIGIPLIFLFLQQLIPMIAGSSNTWATLVLPQRLPEYAAYLILGKPLPSLVPIATVGVALLAFVLLAIIRFKREEFKGA
jgi:ABC-type transport system involved in multi-copper enzyme maturation permease subunit